VSEPPSGVFFCFSDFVAILAFPLVGSLLRQTTENLPRNLCFWGLLSITTVMLIASHDGYRGTLPTLPRRRTGLAINCFFAMSVPLGHAHILARRWTVADLLLTPLLIAFFRTLLARKLATKYDTGRTCGPVVICYDRCPGDLTKALESQQISQRISGVLYLGNGPFPGEPCVWPKLPDTATLLKTIRNKNIQDIVFIHHPELDAFASSPHQELLSDLLAFPARIWLAFDIASNLPEMLKERSGGCKIVPIMTDELVSSVNFAKRGFDLAGGLLLLLLTSPLLLLAACLVKASGPGPIIFRQIRTGAHGRQFTVLKFRTMRTPLVAPLHRPSEMIPGSPKSAISCAAIHWTNCCSCST
jgi:Bacterial sugar transferase